MKKALAIIVLGLLLSSNANAAKGDGVCGLQSNLIKWNYFDKSIKLKFLSMIALGLIL